MPYPATCRRHKIRDESSLNIIPMMNLFAALIPFLVLTAVFASTAVIQLFLPEATSEEGSGKGTDKSQEEKETLNLTVAITDKGFSIGGAGGVLDLIPRDKEGRYNFEVLRQQLSQVKEKVPQQEEIVIVCEDEIIYDLIIQVMDICRETGFPNIGIGRVE
jgi:biopolymer transport protein ExbD